MQTPGTSVSGFVLLLVIQFIFVVLFGVYTDYADDLLPQNGTQHGENFIVPKYPRKFRENMENLTKCDFNLDNQRKNNLWRQNT